MSEAETRTPAETLVADFNRHLRLVFESSPEIMLVLLPDSPRFTIVAATDTRLKTTFTTREATVGRGLFEVFPDNPDTPEATGTSNLRASLERVLATRAPDTMPVQRYDIRGEDGAFHTKYWSPKNLPVLTPAGEVLYILHRVEDVTELVQATELGVVLRDKTQAMEREVIRRGHELAEANRGLREANARLGELDAAKTAFFGNVSHELRTPLTLILGPIEDAIERRQPLGGESLRAVHRNAVRLMHLVNRLLEFSRLEAGRVQASFEEIDLASLTAGIASTFRSLVESAGLRFTVECPPLDGPAFVDRAQWEKIVLNLLSNAYKFTFEGEIAVRLRARADRIELCVSDTGTGIPEHELSRVFERFHRVEGARGRSFEGTGIGLALVHELVGLLKGSVRVESAVGRGTTFTVTIPAGSAHLPKDRIVEARTSAVETKAASFVMEASQWTKAAPDERLADDPSSDLLPTSRSRILLVDDSSDMRAYVAGLLRRHWTVDEAADGEQALARVEVAQPDLILTDLMMPNMDGQTLIKALRASPATRSLPVIVLSARAGEEALLEGLDLGADAYLVKPFSARELISRVRGHLDAARSRSNALRASEARFRRLAESGMIGITIADYLGRVLEANEAFLDMAGYTRDDLLGGQIAWEIFSPAGIHPDRSARAWEGEYRRKDGRRVPVLVAVAPLEDGETIAVTHDLTERKRLEEQFRQAQKMEAVGRLAGGIAHDFNNILSVISTYAELLQADLGPVHACREDIAEIQTAAIRATALTRQLLAFSRQQVLEPKVLSLNAVILGMEKMLLRLLGADIALTVMTAADLWNMLADPGQIEQIIMNLAVNARDAMPMGGKLTIETTNVELDKDYAAAHHEVRPGAYVLLAVTDTGIGIDAQTQARIFEPFFTTKEKGRGTGLGLATVFGIVKQSGGHIWVYSEPGKGATFKLYFPRVNSVATASSEPAPAAGDLRGDETILLVEDDPQVRALARTVLRRSGYTVLEAANGGEALLHSEQHGAKIDLLLTDVVLPFMSGRQIAERLRLLRPGMRVLFMSGYTDEAILHHGVLDSGEAYLQKPLTPSALTRKVREVLDRGSVHHG